MKTALALFIACVIGVGVVATTAAAAAKTHQVTISYEPSKDTDLKNVHKELRERRALEKLPNLGASSKSKKGK